MRSAGWLDLGDAAFALLAGVMLVSTMAIVLAGLIGLALKRRASARHAAWLCALAVVLLSPALAWVGPTLALPPIALPKLASTIADRPERASSTDPAGAGSFPGAASPRRGARREVPIEEVLSYGPPQGVVAESILFVGTTLPAAPAAVAESSRWPRITRGAIVAIWLIGALGLLVRLAWGCREVARLRRSARPFRFGTVLPSVASALRMNVDRLPAIGVSDRTSQPLTLGLIRPSVLMPEGLAASLPADALRDVLIHECAHALRRDTLVGLLQRFAAILCWPNPLVHLMNRALESAREELCDNHVLRAADPADYAASLLAVAERRPFAADFDALLGLPMIARRGTLESRIAALIDPRRHAETSTRRGTVAALAVLFLAAGAAVAAVRFGDAEQPLAVVASSKPLDPTKTRIEGVVVDESGKPAADVNVAAWGWNEILREARTAADGRFLFDVDAKKWFSVVASNADGSLQAVDRHDGGDPAIYPELKTRLTLKPARETTARVVDLQGAPIADATVAVAYRGFATWEYKTDAKGEARVRIAPDAELSSVAAVKPGVGLDYFESEVYWPGPKPAPLPETIELVLDGATAFKVKVVDASDSPVPGVSVLFPGFWKLGKHRGGNFIGPAFTRVADGAGVATFDFIPKMSTQPDFLLVENEDFAVVPALGDRKGPGESLVMRVRRNASVSGRVLSADGEPALGVLVRAEGQGRPFGPSSNSKRTGPDGSYLLTLQPGASYLIGVDDDHWSAPSRGGVLPQDGDRIRGVDFRLAPGALVKGRVTKENGEPAARETICLLERGVNVEHLTVEVRDGQTTVYGSRTETLKRWTKTDAGGSFAFRVGPGSFALPDERVRTELRFVPDDQYTRRFHVEGREVIVRDFKLRDRAGELKEENSVAITVRDKALGGAPASGARITVATSNYEGKISLIDSLFMQTDGHGVFRIEKWARPLYIFAQSIDGLRGGFGTIGVDDFEATVSIDQGATASGRVVSEAGAPIPRAVLYAYLVGPAGVRDEFEALSPTQRNVPQLIVKTDALGRYTLSGLAAGARGHVYQAPIPGKGPNQELGAIDFVVEGLKTVSVPDLVFKPVKP
ncbi:M56 family metallopeptidase [Paludisphaera borealis]|uniref:Regulatory protein BlaR1 n=1 Tax=Paludisphaera borealis TaxID=1387353 RepID=A0A1U7CIZ7_9BACT|nr:M56 family metallopeptidase [Paludisphaera borealis]APW58915.1 Regulatory protein BlaR1 [Paludisphaera borealis]